MQELDKVIPSLLRRKRPGHDSLLNKHIIHGGRYVRVLIWALSNSVTVQPARNLHLNTHHRDLL